MPIRNRFKADLKADKATHAGLIFGADQCQRGDDSSKTTFFCQCYEIKYILYFLTPIL
jgi:hypothetical protein